MVPSFPSLSGKMYYGIRGGRPGKVFSNSEATLPPFTKLQDAFKDFVKEVIRKLLSMYSVTVPYANHESAFEFVTSILHLFS
jgi:hypothetical protein